MQTIDGDLQRVSREEERRRRESAALAGRGRVLDPVLDPGHSQIERSDRRVLEAVVLIYDCPRARVGAARASEVPNHRRKSCARLKRVQNVVDLVVDRALRRDHLRRRRRTTNVEIQLDLTVDPLPLSPCALYQTLAIRRRRALTKRKRRRVPPLESNPSELSRGARE